MRGARYGFPGWVTIEETKRGTKRRYLEHKHEAQAKAVEYLAGAKSAGELAGRTIALVMMAVYAQEDAVANSNRAFHTVTPERALPWAGDVTELIDDLAGEKPSLIGSGTPAKMLASSASASGYAARSIARLGRAAHRLALDAGSRVDGKTVMALCALEDAVDDDEVLVDRPRGQAPSST